MNATDMSPPSQASSSSNGADLADFPPADGSRRVEARHLPRATRRGGEGQRYGGLV